jgi:microsomal dipeptidase-like Zn-dependent dipeptidase
MVSNYAEMQQYITDNGGAANTLFVIMTIEGLHTLNSNLSVPADEASFTANLCAVKHWKYPPFSITFCHHFFNQLCGHAQSLFQIVGQETNQHPGMDTTFTPLGLKILHQLLDNTNGKRIYPDIKHMSAQGRKDYLNILATEFAEDPIPVIVSHGAANGLRSMDEKVIDGTATGSLLMPNDINFYDNEILAVSKSGGLFCIMLDEHRLASDGTLANIQHSVILDKIRTYRSQLVWNQVQHIAELLDRNGLNAWNCMALGSDSDGIINPLNGFLTEETLPDLQNYLTQFAQDYMNNRGNTILQPANQISASEIVNNIFAANGIAFLEKWFI